MPDLPISGLPSVTTPATTDVVPIVTAGVTSKVTIANLVANSGVAAVPGGSNTQIQFNNAGALGGDANLTFATDTLTVSKIVSPSIGATSPGTGGFTALTLSGNISAPTWTTSGVRIKSVVATLTDTTAATGTTAAAYTNVLGGNTIAATNAGVIFTDYNTLNISPPTAGTNVTFTRKHSLGILDATSATTSITGGFVVAAAYGTSATSVGIGGGNVNAGSSVITPVLGFPASSAITAPSNGVLFLQNFASTDFNRLQFGGTTSSFPALKRSGTTLAHRLADDSADGPMSASNGTFSGTLSSGVGSSVGANTVPLSGAGLQIQATDGTGFPLVLDQYGAAAAIIGRRAAGTAGSPTANAANNALLSLSARLYYTSGATGFSTDAGSVKIHASEIPTSTSWPTYVVVNTTPTASTTPVERMRITSAGDINLASATWIGAGTPAIAGNGTLNTGSKDSMGKVTSTGTGASTVVLTFAVPFTRAPACIVTNETTANLVRPTSTTTTLTINATVVTGDVLSYICVGY